MLNIDNQQPSFCFVRAKKYLISSESSKVCNDNICGNQLCIWCECLLHVHVQCDMHGVGLSGNRVVLWPLNTPSMWRSMTMVINPCSTILCSCHQMSTALVRNMWTLFQDISTLRAMPKPSSYQVGCYWCCFVLWICSLFIRMNQRVWMQEYSGERPPWLCKDWASGYHVGLVGWYYVAIATSHLAWVKRHQGNKTVIDHLGQYTECIPNSR